MDLATISTSSRLGAREAFLEYRRAVRESFDAEIGVYDERKLEKIAEQREADQAIMAGYRVLARGGMVLDLRETIRRAGVDARGLPRIAIARADTAKVRALVEAGGSIRFDDPDRLWRARSATRVELAPGTVARPPTVSSASNFRRAEGTAIVPTIPPRLRPTGATSRFWTLFEAEWERVPPKDPALLRPLGGGIYAVVATWDLTPLERAVLGGTRA